ncbi:hypothetical protein ANN_03983 [Periplaneta americana]|uniref:Uncharacterized protein n=1 Tax=Periplaneta americana TaxID=6978 RepID=A0ABQ8T994_PERAM|nr:hypothetical protein ANN_03983 [Periplaneta americana]
MIIHEMAEFTERSAVLALVRAGFLATEAGRRHVVPASTARGQDEALLAAGEVNPFQPAIILRSLSSYPDSVQTKDVNFSKEVTFSVADVGQLLVYRESNARYDPKYVATTHRSAFLVFSAGVE